MTKYNIHVAARKGGEQTVYGPFDTYDEAHAAGMLFARQGMDVELQNADGAMICDFCSSPDVKWSYDVEDFNLSVDREWGSRGNWAACQTCYDLIENGTPQQLAMHSLKTFFISRPEVPDQPEIRSKVYEHVRTVHGEFWKMKRGKATPV
jgi:hypothetical protein